MKKSLKALLLVGLTISMAVACDFGGTSKSSSSNVSSTSSIESSQSSLTSSDSTTSSSSNSSSSTSSNTSVSSSSSSSSSSVASSSSSSSSSSVAPVLTGIELNTNNVKKVYNFGETLDLTGLVVTAKYSNNKTEVVTDYTARPANGTKLEQVGKTTVNIIYQNFNESFEVEVNKVFTRISLNTENVKKTYSYGEALDLTGLVVTANYNDGSQENVTEYSVNIANGTVLKTIGTTTVEVTYLESKASFDVEVSALKETGILVTLDLSTALTFENNVAYKEGNGTVEGGDYAPRFKLTKVSTAEGSMTIVNNRTRLMAGDTIENAASLGGVTKIRVNGGNGNFKLYAGYTQTEMYEFLTAESESGDRIFENIPNLNYFKFVGKYDNYPADISSIEFTYTRNENHELVDGTETPINTLTVNEGEYIKGDKTLVVTGRTVTLNDKTYTYTGIFYDGALLYTNDNGGLLVKYTSNTAVVVRDTNDAYSSLSGEYTKVIGATEIKLYVNGEEVSANTEDTRATMEVGESFTFSATCNAVPTETPVITFTDESYTGEIDPFIGSYMDKGNLYMTDAMSGEECHVNFDILNVYKEDGEYYIDYKDHSDGFYPGVDVQGAEAFTTNDGTKLNSYLTDEVTLIIDRTTQTVDIGYYDVENYAFWAECNGGYTFDSAVESTATFEDGKVEALRKGNFYLTATASNGLEAKYYVKVNAYMFAFITSPANNTAVTLKEGDTYQINATVDENATFKWLTYESGDTSILTVTDTGLVTAIKEGNTYVDVRSADDSVRLKFTVEKGTPKITVTTYSFEDENGDAHTLVIKEGISASIDDTYNFTYSNGLYVYDADENIMFEVRISGSQAYLDYIDEYMALFGYDGPITMYSGDSIYLTFVSSEQVEQGGGQGQGQIGQGGQGQSEQQPQDLIAEYLFDDVNGETHTLVVTEGKTAVIDDTYNFTFDGNHYVYDEDDSVYFDVIHSGGDFLYFYDESMVLFGYENYIITTWSNEGIIDLVQA